MELNRENIVHLLETNDKAVARALIVINERQTATEQSVEHTIVHNGVGFNGIDGKMGTSMAKFYTKHGYLSPKQLAYWRKIDRRGNMRIAKYWKQLIEEATIKRAAKTA